MCRAGEVGPRCAALDLLAAAVEGLGGEDRSSEAVQLAALKAALRCAKEGGVAPVLTACAAVLRAIAQAGALAVWANAGAWVPMMHGQAVKQAMQ